MSKIGFWQRCGISMKWMAGILIAMGILEFLNHLTQYKLSIYGGIVPRDPTRLWTVFTAPFLHFSPQHYVLNSVSFALLGGLVLLEDKRLYVKLTLFCSVFAGLAVWCAARGGSVHAGSSLLIFSYFGFLVASGWYAKSWKSFFLAILIIIFYGGMIIGVLPTEGFISWESHLFGMLAGVFFAKILGKRK